MRLQHLDTSLELRDLRHAGCGKLSQIKWEVVSIPLAGPCRDTETIGGDHRMIDVKAIQIEGDPTEMYLTARDGYQGCMTGLPDPLAQVGYVHDLSHSKVVQH